MRRFLKWGALSLLACLLLDCMGLTVLVDLGFNLIFGWILFLMRIPSLRINGSDLLSGVVCLTLFALGLHFFLGWLFGQLQESGEASAIARWERSWTASLVAVVILMFVAGLASVGIAHQSGWLLTSDAPLFSNGMSALARRVQSGVTRRPLC